MSLGLKSRENVLDFPIVNPGRVEPPAHLHAFPNTFLAVLDPPPDQTPAGIHLPKTGDGWSQRGKDDRKKTQLRLELSVKNLLDLREEWRKAPRQTNQLRRRVEAAADEYKAAWYARAELKKAESAGAAYSMRPDSATIIAVGEGVPFFPHDWVMLAPYSGHRFKEYAGIKDLIVVGLDDDWQDVTPLWYNDRAGLWEPTANWCTIIVEPKEESIQRARKEWHSYGALAQAGPEVTIPAGHLVMMHKDRFVARPDDSRWFRAGRGPFPFNTMFVRERCSEGVQRVVAIIETE